MKEESLPPAMSRYLERAMPEGPRRPRLVRTTQRGEMWRKPGGRPLEFEAVQEYEVRRVGFSWRARCAIAPLLSLEVTDGLTQGEGRLEAKLWGSIPVMLARGSHLGRGEAMRYLAELPWVPHAIAENPELEWRELATGAVEVATGEGPARVDIRFDFDEEGDIYRASSEVRPRVVGRTSIPTPWSGEFWDYQTIGEVRIPTQGEVSWRLPEAEGEFTYWRGRVTSLTTS